MPGSEPVLSSEESAITVQKKEKAPKHQEQKQSKNLVPISLRFFLVVIFLTRISNITGKETSEWRAIKYKIKILKSVLPARISTVTT